MDEKWKCTVCGNVQIGKSILDRCPVCKAESSKYITMPVTKSEIDEETPLEIVESQHILHANMLMLDEIGESFSGTSMETELLTIDESIVISADKESLVIVIDGFGKFMSDCDVRKLNGSEEMDNDDEDVDQNEDIDVEKVEPDEEIPAELDDKPEDNDTDTPDEAESGQPPEQAGTEEQIPDENEENLVTLKENDILIVPEAVDISIHNKGDIPIRLLLIKSL